MMPNATRTHFSASQWTPLIMLGSRLLLSVLFIFAGIHKLTAIPAVAGWFASLGLPIPSVFVVASGLVELIGGVAVAVGWKTKSAGLVLAAFTIVATLIAHRDLSDEINVLMLQKNLGLVGGFLLVALFGPGLYSLDQRRLQS